MLFFPDLQSYKTSTTFLKGWYRDRERKIFIFRYLHWKSLFCYSDVFFLWDKINFFLKFYNGNIIFRCIIDPSVSMYSLDNKRFAYCVQAFKFSSYAEVCLRVALLESLEIFQVWLQVGECGMICEIISERK